MPDSPELNELFEAAVRFFETGDDASAAMLFTRYLESGGSRQAEARDFQKRCAAAPPPRSVRRGGPEKPESRPVAPFGGTPGVRRGGDAAESAASPDDKLWRRPHMDPSVSGILQPGQKFTVSVFTDKSDPSVGEMTEDIAIAAPDSQTVFDLEVTLLATPHFQVAGAALQPLRIERSVDRSPSIPYIVQVQDAAALAALPAAPAPSLTALFSYQGRPAGSVSRKMAVAGVAAPAAGAAQPGAGAPRPALRVEATARPADLTVVVAATPENDNRHFLCTVRSPLLPQYASGMSQPWNLPDTTFNIVQAFMNEFTANVGKLMRVASLRGAGKRLFDAAPQVFRDAYWTLVDSGVRFASIAIVTSEPYIPWELMIPSRPTQPGQRPETRQPLGVEFAVGRWANANLTSASQSIPLKDSFIVAPAFAGAQALPQGQKEAAIVQGLFPGDVIKPATGENIDQVLGQGTGRSLLHIVCHGNASAVPQTLLLDNNQKLSVFQLCGLDGVETAFLARPFVFLNACEVGRLMPALAGPDGFAPAFIQLGAAAVIAPLWSVMDTIAFEVASTFYNLVKQDPGTPFAAVLSKLRAKSYDPNIGEDTYAAYCFYGDPLASAA